MQMNSERLAALNLQTLASNLIPAGQKKGKEKISGDESEDYHPENDSEDSRDEDEVFDAPPAKIKRTKQQVTRGPNKTGPVTRARINYDAVASEEVTGHGKPDGDEVAIEEKCK